MRTVRVLCVLALALACPRAGGGEVRGAVGISPTPVYLVPWKTLNRGSAPVRASLILYWIPASRDDMRRSELLTSRTLTTYASQCVGMQLIRPDDYAMIERLGAEGDGVLPVAILTDGAGKELARVDNEEGSLRAIGVERMVRDELLEREADLDRMLDEADSLSEGGEQEAALAIYREVLAQQCLFPRKARDAQRAIKRLALK